MDNYLKVKSRFEENSCKLLTDFDEFEKLRETSHNKNYNCVRVNYIGVCGHNCNVAVTNFFVRKTGLRCKECVKRDTGNKLSKRDKNESSSIESDGVNILSKYLDNKYEIKRTNEGCRADLAIRKKGSDVDLWIPIQLKSTGKLSHKMYSFRTLNKDYKDMLIVCVCISEEKIWIIPFNDLKLKNSLNISVVSKYNKYFVENKEIINEDIEKHIDKIKLLSLDDCMIPVAELQKREQEYANKRKKYINFLNYKCPNIQNSAVDFMVNNKNIQEKVGGYSKYKNKKGLMFYLSSNDGKKENGYRNFRTYRLGENDYYWFHSSIDDRFWIVPEKELYDRKYISEKDETKKNKLIVIPINDKNYYHSKEWLKEYEYNYSIIDDNTKNKIISLFE